MDTHADAFNRLHRRPAGRAEEVEADDAVAIDVGVHGDGPWGIGCTGEFDKLDFWWFCGIISDVDATARLCGKRVDSPMGYFDPKVNLSR